MAGNPMCTWRQHLSHLVQQSPCVPGHPPVSAESNATTQTSVSPRKIPPFPQSCCGLTCKRPAQAVQTVDIHTSCSKSLYVGQHFGAITIDDFPEFEVCNPPTASPTLSPTPSCPIAITLIGPTTITFEAFTGAVYTEQGATAIASYCLDITSRIAVGGDVVDTSVVGTYEVDYTVTDAHGQTAINTRTIHVIDTTPPVITFPNGSDLGDPVGDHPSVTNFLTSASGGASSGAATSSGFDAVVALATDPGVAASTVDFTIEAFIAAGYSRTDGATLTDTLTLQRDTGAGGTLQPANFGVLNFTWNPGSTATMVALAGRVVLTATDASGNAVDINIAVVVVDTEAPHVECPRRLALQSMGSDGFQNAYAHPSGTLAYVYQTDPGAGFATEPQLPPLVSFSDNSQLTVIQGVVERTIDVGTIGADGNVIFTGLDQSSLPQTFQWNPSTTATSISSSGDVDADGLTEHAPGGGNIAARSAVTLYTATDQTGNRAECSVDIFVVDLEDPVIECPTSLNTNSLTNALGNAMDGRGTNVNRYTHPPSSANIGSVFVYQTDPGLAYASIGTTPLAPTVTDNTVSEDTGFPSFEVHRTVTDFPLPSAPFDFQPDKYSWHNSTSCVEPGFGCDDCGTGRRKWRRDF